jgi:hypothetical protein
MLLSLLNRRIDSEMIAQAVTFAERLLSGDLEKGDRKRNEKTIPFCQQKQVDEMSSSAIGFHQLLPGCGACDCSVVFAERLHSADHEENGRKRTEKRIAFCRQKQTGETPPVETDAICRVRDIACIRCTETNHVWSAWSVGSNAFDASVGRA